MNILVSFYVCIRRYHQAGADICWSLKIVLCSLCEFSSVNKFSIIATA